MSFFIELFVLAIIFFFFVLTLFVWLRFAEEKFKSKEVVVYDRKCAKKSSSLEKL